MTNEKIQGDWGEANRGVGQEMVDELGAPPPETEAPGPANGTGLGVGPTIEKKSAPPQPGRREKP